MCDRRARRRTKIRRLAYRLGLAENQCTGNLTVASDFLVPIAVSRESQDRSFADMVRGAKADLQIAGPFSLTQLAPVQRLLT